MLCGKVIAIPFIGGLKKSISLYKMSYYPEPGSYRRNKIKVELGLAN